MIGHLQRRIEHRVEFPHHAQKIGLTTQQQLAGNMVDYWTAFAANSNPNHVNTPNWPLFNVVTGETQSFVPPTPVNELTFAIDHKCAFWDAASGRVLP